MGVPVVFSDAQMINIDRICASGSQVLVRMYAQTYDSCSLLSCLSPRKLARRLVAEAASTEGDGRIKWVTLDCANYIYPGRHRVKTST